jgi:hypothetical protein
MLSLPTDNREAEALRPLVEVHWEGVHLLDPLLQLVLRTRCHRVHVIVPPVVILQPKEKIINNLMLLVIVGKKSRALIKKIGLCSN